MLPCPHGQIRVYHEKSLRSALPGSEVELCAVIVGWEVGLACKSEGSPVTGWSPWSEASDHCITAHHCDIWLKIETTWENTKYKFYPTSNIAGDITITNTIKHTKKHKLGHSQVTGGSSLGSPRQHWLSGSPSIFTLRGIPHHVSWNCRSYLSQIPSTSPNLTPLPPPSLA